jgi:hypothetical protein
MMMSTMAYYVASSSVSPELRHTQLPHWLALAGVEPPEWDRRRCRVERGWSVLTKSGTTSRTDGGGADPSCFGWDWESGRRYACVISCFSISTCAMQTLSDFSSSKIRVPKFSCFTVYNKDASRHRPCANNTIPSHPSKKERCGPPENKPAQKGNGLSGRAIFDHFHRIARVHAREPTTPSQLP